MNAEFIFLVNHMKNNSKVLLLILFQQKINIKLSLSLANFPSVGFLLFILILYQLEKSSDRKNAVGNFI